MTGTDQNIIRRAEYAAMLEEGIAARYRRHALQTSDTMTQIRLERRAAQRELTAGRAREIAEEARTRLYAMPRQEQHTPRFIQALRRMKENTTCDR